MIIGIIIGLLIWFVVPMFFTDGKRRKRKKRKQQMIELTCKIIGLVIIVFSLVRHFLYLYNTSHLLTHCTHKNI